MKTTFSILLSAISVIALKAQTNTLPTSGNVGIGTSAPQAPLEIKSDTGAFTLGDLLRLNSVSGNSGNGPAILFTNNNDVLNLARIAAVDAGDWGGALVFQTAPATGAPPGGAPVERVRIDSSGNVGIGTTNPTQKLSVNGTIRAHEVIVDSGWSDYVFASNYRLAPLSEVEQHIKMDGHLPGIPSASDVAEHGVTVGEMQAKLLAKIEELTLHVIEQEKRIEMLEQENRKLRVTP